jgi:phage FluMu protein Com
MSDRFGSALLTVECPGCQARTQHTLRHLGTSPELRCLTCNSLLRVDGAEVRLALATLEAAAQAMLDGGVRRIG